MDGKAPKLLFYLIVPGDIATANPGDFAHVIKALRHMPGIVHQFVPFALLNAKLWTDAQIASFVISTYDRCAIQVGRTIQRREFEDSGQEFTEIDAPAFVVAQPRTPQFRYTLDWGAQENDLTERHILLHMGYKFSRCRKWVFATCIDQRGETQRIKTWDIDILDGDGSREDRAIQSLWVFLVDFTRHLNAEWTVIICKAGRLTGAEVKGMVSERLKGLH